MGRMPNKIENKDGKSLKYDNYLEDEDQNGFTFKWGAYFGINYHYELLFVNSWNLSIQYITSIGGGGVFKDTPPMLFNSSNIHSFNIIAGFESTLW